MQCIDSHDLPTALGACLQIGPASCIRCIKWTFSVRMIPDSYGWLKIQKECHGLSVHMILPMQLVTVLHWTVQSSSTWFLAPGVHYNAQTTAQLAYPSAPCSFAHISATGHHCQPNLSQALDQCASLTVYHHIAT
jgi:hypothetical protein